MSRPNSRTAPTLRDLLLSSDFGRANPRRVEELLDRLADPVTETRNEHRQERSDA